MAHVHSACFFFFIEFNVRCNGLSDDNFTAHALDKCKIVNAVFVDVGRTLAALKSETATQLHAH